MNDYKERFKLTRETLENIILEFDKTDLTTDVVLFVACSMQNLLKLTVDVISHRRCLLDSVLLRSSCERLDDAAVFSLDEFVSRLVSGCGQDEVAALPDCRSVYSNVDCALYTAVPKVKNTQGKRKLCRNSFSEASGATIDVIKIENDFPGDVGNVDFIDSKVALQDQYMVDAKSAKKKSFLPCSTGREIMTREEETSAPLRKRNYQEVCSSLKHKFEKMHSKIGNKGVLQQNSRTLCKVLEEKAPNKSLGLQSRTKRKTSKASNCLNFVSFQCFICNSDVIYENFRALARHVVSVHTSQNTDGRTVLLCPRSADGCCWSRMTRSAISRSVLAQVLSHLVCEHNIPVPSYVSLHHCGYVGCNHQSFRKHECDSHRAGHQMDTKVECQDCDVLTEPLSLAVHQKHCTGTGLKVTVIPCIVTGCSKRFKSRKSLKRHLETVHRRMKKSLCFQCERSFSNKCDYYQHVYSQHGQNELNRPVLHCQVCSFSAVVTSSMRHHLATVHPQVCSVMEAVKQMKVDCNSDSRVTELKHIKSGLAADNLPMPTQSGTAHGDFALIDLTGNNLKYCSGKEILKSHRPDHNHDTDLMEADGETELEEEDEEVESQVTENRSNIIRFIRFQCFLCLVSDTVFETSSALFNHVRDTHLTKDGDANILACPYCGDKKVVQKGVRSSQLSRLLSHMVKKHKCSIPDYIDPFHCPEPNCSFFSIRRYELNTHSLKHCRPEEKVPCDKCGKFMQQRSLATHAKFCSAADGSRPLFECSMCDKVMSTKQGLQKHFQTIHENRRDFLCSECTRTFGGKGELEDHAFRRHGVNISNKSVYACPQCSFATIIPFSLKRHISEVHSDIRQHQCPVCNKFFKSKLQLKSHKVAHEERTHRCSVCDYTAARKSNLEAHIKAQHSGVQYKCEDCGYHTGYYANLCKHQRMTCSRSRSSQHATSIHANNSGGSFDAFLTHANVV